MILQQLDIFNYKNLADVHLAFSPRLNCLIGDNGMGKTNVLDAIYFLSFCKSCTGQTDASVINHEADAMMLTGHYLRRDTVEEISIAMQRGRRKVARRGGKEYKRLSQHIGLLPLVMVAPADWDLIRGPGEERRRFMDQIISQGDSQYLAALIAYNRALEQRNAMIRQQMTDPLLYETVEAKLCEAATAIHQGRQQWLAQFQPIFMRYYEAVAGPGEAVSLTYRSHLNEAPMRQVLDSRRQRDLAVGHTTGGTHRDDIELLLGQHAMRRTGSQGQCKTYTIALRLAQFDFLRQASGVTPLLLLDDIFDKLDATRVARIIQVVKGNQFGQIFITDTNRAHLDELMAQLGGGDDAMWSVSNGTVTALGTGGAAQP